MSERITSYAEFWPHYLCEHAKQGTRYIHYFGTSLFLVCMLALLVTREWGFLALGILAGYGFAWIGHFFIEKNRPATFRHPLWSLISDFRMLFAWLAGALPRELRKAGLES